MALNTMLYFVTFLRSSIYGKIFELNVQNVAKVVLESPVTQKYSINVSQRPAVLRVCGRSGPWIRRLMEELRTFFL